MADLLRLIADARARMLMRGYDPLQLEIGQRTLQQLMAEADPGAARAGEVLGMVLTERFDMEGFAVLPATA